MLCTSYGTLAPNARLAELLRKTASEAAKVIAKEQVLASVVLTMAMVEDAVEKVKGAIMIVYPMGLPPHEAVKLMLEDKENLTGQQDAKMVIPEAEAELWWAGKQLQRSKRLGDFVGKNEKTKIVVKLQKRGGGAPAREPVVDEKTQKEMMAFAYKKQEELKKLQQANDDTYLDAEWAHSGALKSRLQGTSNIAWK